MGLESSLSERKEKTFFRKNIGNFFRESFFVFRAWDWKVRQVGPVFTTGFSRQILQKEDRTNFGFSVKPFNLINLTLIKTNKN